MHEITEEMLNEFSKDVTEDPDIRTLGAALAKTEMKDVSFVPVDAAKLNGEFSVEVKTRGITFQQKSVRCWMFSCLNILREKVAEECHLKEFHLSGNYLAFYDKLERFNNLLEMAAANADKPLNDRLNSYILDSFGDGGYWTMDVDLIHKYGIVPESIMPETWQSTHTESIDQILQTALRKDIAELRRLSNNGEDVQTAKKKMLAEVYKAECIAFGTPVKKFDFSYRDEDETFHCDYAITPVQFYRKYAENALDNYTVVTNYPVSNRKMNHLISYHYAGSMANSDILNLNISIADIEKLCIKQLQSGEPVWFGCDSRAYGNRSEGVWDPSSFTYSRLLGNIHLEMDKTTRLETHDSSATHAMILTGVNLAENGKPNRWKIENSWGKEAGKDGYFVCSEEYFLEYVYEAVINKKYLNEEQLKMLKQEPIKIEPWEI